MSRKMRDNPNLELSEVNGAKRWRRKPNYVPNTSSSSAQQVIADHINDIHHTQSQSYSNLVDTSMTMKSILESSLQGKASEEEKQQAYEVLDQDIIDVVEDHGFAVLCDKDTMKDTSGIVHMRIRDVCATGSNMELVDALQDSIDDYLHDVAADFAINGDTLPSWDKEWDGRALVPSLKVYDGIDDDGAKMVDDVFSVVTHDRLRFSSEDALRTSLSAHLGHKFSGDSDATSIDSFYIVRRDLGVVDGTSRKGWYLYSKNKWDTHLTLKRERGYLTDIPATSQRMNLIEAYDSIEEMAIRLSNSNYFEDPKNAFQQYLIYQDSDDAVSHWDERGIDPINLYRGHSMATEVEYQLGKDISNVRDIEQSLEDAKTFNNQNWEELKDSFGDSAKTVGKYVKKTNEVVDQIETSVSTLKKVQKAIGKLGDLFG